MSRFSDEYIQFCRNAALPRDFRQGDWVYYPDEHDAPDNPRPVGRQAGERYFANEWRVWLPVEGDWLDLLEAEGVWSVRVSRRKGANMGPGDFEARVNFDNHPTPAYADDRLTALGHLWQWL